MSSARSSEDRLGYQLKLAQHALRKRMEKILRPLGLTLPQYAAMAELERHPDWTNADLAAKAFITPQSMQGVLANLEMAGLVERRQDARHGRRQLARLTDAGLSKVAQAHRATSVVDEAIQNALAPLVERDVRAFFARVLSALEPTRKPV